jgi:hypothetical protein
MVVVGVQAIDDIGVEDCPRAVLLPVSQVAREQVERIAGDVLSATLGQGLECADGGQR